MKVTRPPELTLLLMACTIEPSEEKTAQLVLFLAQHSLDWDRLHQLAGQHRVVPFLYRRLQPIPDIPESFLATLRDEYRRIATDTLLKLREYHRVSALLAEHVIEHVAFKGVYLAEHSYPESSLRPIGDLDILVGKENLYKAIHVLAADDYQVGDKYQPYQRYAERIMLEDLYEISLFKPFFNTSRFDIDLHWEVNCLLKEIASFDLNDVLSPPGFRIENQVMLLVIHHGVISLWERISYINDLYFLLNKADINWPWLLEKLKRYQLETIFFAGLHWCQQLWGLPLPPSVQLLVSTNQLRLLAEAYEKNWTKQLARPFKIRVFNFANNQVLLADKLKIYAAYGQSFIFRSSFVKINHNWLYIPKEWGFVTVVVRAFRALLRPR